MSADAGASAPPKIPLSVGLLSRRSITGALVVGLVALLYIVVLPILAPIINTTVFTAGRPYVTEGGVQVTPAPGWELTGDSLLFATLAKGGATFILTIPAEPTGTLEDAAQVGIDGLEGAGWAVSELVTFVTDAGDHGVYYTAHSATDASENWIIDSGDLRLTIIGSSPESIWPSVMTDMDAMARSVVFVGPSGGSS